VSKIIKLTYYGIEGEGPTVTAAKQDAGRQLEHIVKQTEDSPTIIRIGAVVALVAFQRWGWGHTIIEGIAEPQTGHVYPSGGYATRGEAELGALKHVLDCAWKWPEDDAAWFDAVIAGKPGVYFSPREVSRIRGEFLAQCKWQRDYKAARAQGYDDQDARYLIGGLTHLIKHHPTTATNRPGDAAAVLHEESGIPYEQCLVMCNMD
jgi:hypothetical protein